MKLRPIAIALFSLMCLFAMAGIFDHAFTYYPTPETESAFLKSYTPKPVIDQFREKKSSSWSGSMSAGAGHKFVTHEGGFEFHVVMRRENWVPLMNALQQDVLEQLAVNDAEVVNQTGNGQTGFRLDYRIDRTIGSLIILPVALNSRVQRNMPLPEGLEDVTVKIEQTEKWFPKGIVSVDQKL